MLDECLSSAVVRNNIPYYRIRVALYRWLIVGRRIGPYLSYWDHLHAATVGRLLFCFCFCPRQPGKDIGKLFTAIFSCWRRRPAFHSVNCRSCIVLMRVCIDEPTALICCALARSWWRSYLFFERGNIIESCQQQPSCNSSAFAALWQQQRAVLINYILWREAAAAGTASVYSTSSYVLNCIKLM